MTVSVLTATGVVLDLVATAQKVGSIIQGAQASGRDVLSQEEWAGIRRIADDARTNAEAAVADLFKPATAEGTGALVADPEGQEGTQDTSGEVSPVPVT